MKILFVCRGNVGRSQIALSFFERMSFHHEADSAGTHVDRLAKEQNLTSLKVKDSARQKYEIPFMKSHRIDISENIRKQLTPELVDEADTVIMITEKETWPDYLGDSEKVVFWDIPDAVGQSEEFAYKVFDEVRQRVEQLVQEIG